VNAYPLTNIKKKNQMLIHF